MVAAENGDVGVLDLLLAAPGVDIDQWSGVSDLIH